MSDRGKQGLFRCWFDVSGFFTGELRLAAMIRCKAEVLAKEVAGSISTQQELSEVIWGHRTVDDERAVPMSPRLILLLRRLPRRGRWVLTAKTTKKHPEEGRQISERRALAALKRVLAKIGIAGKLHSFRHSFISHALTAGIEEAVVRLWVGHVNATIMRTYTHISSKVSQDRIKLLGESAPGQDSASGDTKTA